MAWRVQLLSVFALGLFSCGAFAGSDLSGTPDANSGTFSFGGAVDPLSQTLAERRAVFTGQSDVLSLRWSHRLTEEGSLSLAAGLGDDPNVDESQREGSTSTMASLSWINQWGGKFRPSLTGSLFASDSLLRDESYGSVERRYYGFAIGGRVTLFEHHSPFVSFRMLRSDELSNTSDTLTNSPEYARLTAGWDWQIRPHWRVRAEADYSLSDPNLNLYRFDRSGIFFTTHLDFRSTGSK
jgi:hypothetical protein